MQVFVDNEAPDAEFPFIGYIGNYLVRESVRQGDGFSGVLEHHMRAASDPTFLIEDVARAFTVSGDQLLLGDDRTWRRTWRRLTEMNRPIEIAHLSAESDDRLDTIRRRPGHVDVRDAAARRRAQRVVADRRDDHAGPGPGPGAGPGRLGAGGRGDGSTPARPGGRAGRCSSRRPAAGVATARSGSGSTRATCVGRSSGAPTRASIASCALAIWPREAGEVRTAGAIAVR